VPDPANPWSQPTQQPGRLEPALHQAMMAGKLNPWLNAQSNDLPRQLGHDFTKGGSPVRHLTRIAKVCKSVGSRLMVAYVPFCGVVSRRYVPSLVDLGMDRTTGRICHHRSSNSPCLARRGSMRTQEPPLSVVRCPLRPYPIAERRRAPGRRPGWAGLGTAHH
jgi:hypothetical protein